MENFIENSKQIIWHTEKRKIKDLIPTEGNPRKLTEKEAKDLENSLKKFNLVDIPVINLDNKIISGHQRITILKKLGRDEEEIDVRVPNRMLTEEEHREYLLRANKNLGEWDYNLLINFDEELLKEVGWEDEELEMIFALNEIENVGVDTKKINIITVEQPKAPRLKERMSFYCDNIEEYIKIISFFKKDGKEWELDKDKLLKLIEKNEIL
jgi:hypothetical protein